MRGLSLRYWYSSPPPTRCRGKIHAVIATLSSNEATLWTAVAAAGGAVLGAFIAAVVTFVITKRSVESAESTAAKQREHEWELAEQEMLHEIQLASEARNQERLLNAYTELQRYASDWVQAANWRIRPYRMDPPTPQPDIHTADPRSIAITSLVASPQVDELFTDFNRLVNLFLVAIRRSEDAKATNPQGPALADPGAYGAMAEAGRAVITKGLELNNQMRRELGRPPLPIET